MRKSCGNLILPAVVAAALVVTAFDPAAAGFERRGGFSKHHHGTRTAHHHGHRNGLRFLPTLPRLVRTPDAGGRTQAVRVPGIPAPVRQAVAGFSTGDGHRFGGYDGYGGYGAYDGYGGYGLPTVLPGGGTYVGGVEAAYIFGNGNYFAVDGALDLAEPAGAPRPMAKIIEVKPELQDAACDMQHGVCIIRP